MTTPMIDRLKERIAELEMQNTQLQTLLACAIAEEACQDGSDSVFITADNVREWSGRTITSEPREVDGVVVGVLVTVDPITLPDFGGDMQGLLAREDRR